MNEAMRMQVVERRALATCRARAVNACKALPHNARESSPVVVNTFCTYYNTNTL